MGSTILHEPIEGVVLSYHRMSTPGFAVSTKGIGEGVKLNYCVSGRLEVSMADGHTMFMAPGDLSVETSTAWDFSFPCAFYEGVELFLHRSSLARPPEFFAACGVDLNEIAAHLRAGRIRNWTRAAAPEESRLFRELIPGAGDFEHARLRLTIPLLLLRIAGSGAPRRESESAIYSRRQVDIAKRAEALLTDDISRRRSIAKVAALLGVRPTTLKGYFKGVYGVCISDYLLDVRMSRAEKLLKHGDSPVADIAHAVGYANVGKFCEAFRRKFGMTPLKYRFQTRSAAHA